MGNLVSVLTHCGRGDEMILGQEAHIFLYEGGGASALGGVQMHTVPNLPNGMLDPVTVENAIRGDNVHFPRTRLIALENTHNRCGGAALSPAQMATIKTVADRYGVATHLDGARIFNAAVALGIDVREIAAQVDSVQFCFSKGLATPVGSMICASADFVREARRHRKAVGGGMRQAGVLAAAAIVALEEMVDRLAEDHENARLLAQGLAEIDGLAIDLDAVQTNIVMFGLDTPAISINDVIAGLSAEGIKISAITATRFRAVTHYGIEREDIETTLAAVRRVMGALT
jgi:threonine aldolase